MILRPKFIQILSLVVTGLLLINSKIGFAAGSSVKKSKQPHIILIITDQQRGDCVGWNNSHIKTPNIDCIGKNGIAFKNGYSSTPSCTPARAGLLTGQAPWNHGMLGYAKVARKYKYEMPRMLANLGYYTFGIGKMHWFPQKSLHGFHGTLVDESGRVEQDGYVGDYQDWFKLNAPGEDPNETNIGWNDSNAGVYQLPEELHPTAWTGKSAVELINNYKQDNPLFLKVSFARPHSPYDPPQRYLDRYDGVEIPEPSIGEWAKDFSITPDSPSAAFGDYGKEYAVNSRRHYYANISFIDDQVGNIIQALKDNDMYDDAIICFTSDHGDMLGDHHHWRKTYAYQGSANIPYLIQWPKWMKTIIERGTVSDYPVELRDFLPTFLDAAGSSIPEDMDGESLLTLLKEKNPKWREYIDLEHATCYSKENYWCALTDGEMKYIWFFATGKEQLFNLRKDPHEIHDCSADEKDMKTLLIWRKRMIEHLKERGDDFVNDGKLVIRNSTLLLGPNYPGDTSDKKEQLKYWIMELDKSYVADRDSSLSE
jgi:arylsulfatase